MASLAVAAGAESKADVPEVAAGRDTNSVAGKEERGSCRPSVRARQAAIGGGGGGGGSRVMIGRNRGSAR